MMGKQCNIGASLHVVVVVVVAITIINLQAANGANRSVPAIFLFGDSAIDIGTNNDLENARAKANYPYYGIDYPKSRPTGRFSNGYNIGDQLAMLLGFTKSPPAFLYLANRKSNSYFKKKVQRGVNFASAGAGIRYHTGFKEWGAVIPMDDQIEQFGMVRANISEARGEKATAKLISEALYIVFVGANDIFDYRKENISIPKDQYIAMLQSGLHEQLKELYKMGGRKFGIIGVPQIGCLPIGRYVNRIYGDGSDGCMELFNDMALSLYNSTLSLLLRISSSPDFPHFTYSLGNAYAMTVDVLHNYASYGFKETKIACCGFGEFNAVIPCNALFRTPVCQNRSDYFFWDFAHPSEAASSLLAQGLFSLPMYTTPITFSQLAHQS